MGRAKRNRGKRHWPKRDAGHQLFYARRTLAKHGIPDDLVDLEALMDFSLTYRENYHLVVLPVLEEHSERLRLEAMERRAARAARRRGATA